MSILSKLLWWRRGDREASPAAAQRPGREKIVALPAEPYVLECNSCGKVFEARRRRPACPECDSSDVAVMSD